MSKDYYKTLGVDKNASTEEIKSAYKKLALRYHPDKNKGDKTAEEKFKEINEAYQVLSNPEKRSSYDQFGTADFSGGNRQGFDFGGAGRGFDGFNFSSFGEEGFGDIFDAFFGGGRRKKKRGSDIEIIISLTFEEAVFGAEKEISYSVLDECPNCQGRGGENMKTCKQCNGSGKIVKATRTILGSFSQTTICPGCNGRGETPENKCRNCSGAGRTRQQKTLNVKIPAGVNNDSSIRIDSAGEAGEDGSPRFGEAGKGDLYLRIKVKPHKEFSRRGYDIYSEKEISFSSAALGEKIEVNTIYGPVQLNIPAGTSSHTEFRLKDKGVLHPTRKTKGDHFILIKIKVPKKLTREEKELLEKWKKISD